MKYPAVPLCELGEIVTGSTPDTTNKSYWGGDISWITPADLTNHEGIYFKGKLRKITETGYKSCPTKMLPAGSIVFSTRAPIGHCAVTTFPLCTNQGFKSIIPNARLDPVYGFFALKFFTRQIQNLGRGATFAEVNKEAFESFAIPVPSLPEQRRIASLLKRADHLRQLRRTARDLGDSLLQSVFWEMFGDFNKYDKVLFDELAAKSKNSFTNGPFGSNLLTTELVSKGVPVVYIRDITSGYYQRVSTSFVTVEKAKELDSCRVDGGDVLIAKVGTPPGTAAVYPITEPAGIVSQDVIRIKPNKKIIHPEFLVKFLNSDIGHNILKPILVEGTRERFGLTPMKELEVPIPPLSLQEEFAGVVRRVEALRARMSEAERQVEGLFEALLSKAFGD